MRVLIVFSPPTLIFEYDDRTRDEQATSKLRNENGARHKRILLNPNFLFDENWNIDSMALQIYRKFPCFFSNKDGISLVQLKSLLTKMRMNDSKLLDTFSGQEHLNKISEEANLKKTKQAMEASFNRNRIPPNSNGYQYDRRVDFDMVSKNSWDE